MKKNTALVIFAIILVIIIALWFGIHKTTVKPTFYYPDEPKIKNAKIISPWTTPKNIVIISADKTTVNQKLADKIWQNPIPLGLKIDYLNQQLKKFNMLIYYDYFYSHGLIPESAEHIQLGDGSVSTFTVNFGVGCASCHDNYITLFFKDNIYLLNRTQGYLYPRNDRKGFYVTSEIRNFKTPYSDPPDAIEIDRFQWNGNGFIEVGARTIAVYKNPITKNQAEVVK
jgi:hypothetical protein